MAERERKKEICSPPPVPQPWTLHGGRNRWTEAVFRDEKERDWNRQVCHATDYTAGAPFHAIYRGAIVYQSTRRETRGEHRAQRLLFNVINIWARFKGHLVGVARQFFAAMARDRSSFDPSGFKKYYLKKDFRSLKILKKEDLKKELRSKFDVR